jgi:hypothetical protein
MILYPPTPSNFPGKNEFSKLVTSEFIDGRLKNVTQSLDGLFNNSLPTKNNFGANEVWAFYTKNWQISEKIFFPDVGIFSKKVRLFDLFHKFYYACYSNFSYQNAKNKLISYFIFFTPKLLLITHPYVLIENNWNNSRLIKELNFFRKNALLFVPKSTTVITRTISKKSLISGIKQCQNYSGAGVTLCVYYNDFEAYRKLNLPPNVSLVSCGSRFDILFYFRLNLLIKSHKFVAYFQPGSYSLYAAISNKMQKNLNKRIKMYFFDAYQVSRLPKDEDLIIFHDIFKGLSKKRITKEPIYIEDLKQFLAFSKPNFQVRKNNYLLYFLSFFWFKLIRRIVRIAEKCKVLKYTLH